MLHKANDGVDHVIQCAGERCALPTSSMPLDAQPERAGADPRESDSIIVLGSPGDHLRIGTTEDQVVAMNPD